MHRAGHRELRHRPVAAARQRLGAPRDALAALEDAFDERVQLERLQQIVGRGRGVAVVEVDDEPDRDEVLALGVLHRVHPGAAELPVLGGDLQRPRLHERVDHAVERLGDLPDLLDAELPDLRLAALGEVELADRGAGEMAPAALGEDGGLGLDVGAGLEVAERLAVLAAALVAGAHADDATVLDDELRGGGLGEDVGAGLFGLLLLVARQRRHRDHLVAVVLEVRHRRDRHRELGLRAGEHVHRLLRDLAEREARLAPLLAGEVGEQLLQRPRAHDRAGEVVPAAGLGLLDHCDRHFAEALQQFAPARPIVAEQLQQAVGAGEAGGAAADDRDADLDQLVLGVETALDELLLGVDRRWVGRGGDLAVARAVMSGHSQASYSTGRTASWPSSPLRPRSAWAGSCSDRRRCRGRRIRRSARWSPC